MTLVHHFLERNARLYPDKVALIHGKVRATYSEINSLADNLASYLISCGVQRGDRVGLLMENCLEYVISYYGIMKAGAVAAPLNSDLKTDGLRYVIGDLEAKLLISSSKFEKLVLASRLDELGLIGLILKGRSVQSAMSYELVSFDSAVSSSPMSYQLSVHSGLSAVSCELSPSDLASIVYTSGSTGGPKGVMLSHRNIVDNTFSICQYLHLTDKDIQMVVLPFFYVMGKSLLNTHFAVGGTVIINNKFAFPAAVLSEMIVEKVTGFSGVPSTFAYLLHRSPLTASRDKLSSLRYVSQAGGHMSRAIKEGLRKVLPAHTEIVIMYGATEAAARLSYLEPERFSKKMDSIGTAIPGVTLRVLDEQGRDAPIGQVGELVAAGTNIMRGYWKNPEATAVALINGWYRTGDQAYAGDEGFYFVVGRRDDLLKVGGHRINPQDIEDRLMESGLFLEVVVLGIPDELLGHRLALLAVPSGSDCTENAVLAYCSEKLPKYKIPSEVSFIRALPKKASGKVDRKACAASYKSVQPVDGL